MCPPAASPTRDIDLHFGEKEICMLLDGICYGNPLPCNVTSDVNPYQYHPSALPEGIWFLIQSKQKKDSDSGYWRTKGDASKIFYNSSMTGWKNTLDFFEGQAPLGIKTNWVMQEYWITRKMLSQSINENEICLLCNVCSVDEQKMAQTDTVEKTTQSVFPKAENDLVKCATSKSQMGEVNITRLDDSVVEGNPCDLANIVEEDYFNEGDFLELLDLETPISPLSNSDSSCMTLSSGECFEPIDLLKDLEFDRVLDVELNETGSGCKPRVFESSRPNEMAMTSGSTATVCKSPSEEEPEINVQISCKVNDPSKSQKSESRNEEIPPTSQNQAVSDEDEKSDSSRRKKKAKKKYFCFLPF